MLFQTLEFLVLLCIVMLAVAVVQRARGQQFFLLAASYVFYGWWDVRFLLLLLLSSMVDYSIALGVGGVKLDRSSRARLSILGICGSWICLGLNWPALQQSGMWTWGELLNPTWIGAQGSLGLAIGFCAVAPFVYELFYLLPESSRRRWMLATSVAVNLGLLGFFKYCNFFLDSAAGIGGLFGAQWTPDLLQFALPVGISFYTFQTLSYTIDAYRRTITPERSFLRVALYVAYFPQLVAGPIMRPKEFLPSLNKRWTLTAERMWSGFHLAMKGLVKKVVIADSVAVLADSILDAPEGRPSMAIMLGASLFAVQIYCDFSGYTDIARGISRVFGVEIPLNFRDPYFSTSIIDFWRRWHISLSTWLRDYLYIPLGGSRGSSGRTHVNLMATMVLGGLWHGAAWNFVIWGAYQGGLLCINREFRTWVQRRPRLDLWMQSRPGSLFRWACTMYLVLLGWLIFRVTDGAALASAIRSYVLLDGDLNLTGFGLGNGLSMISLVAMGAFAIAQLSGQLAPNWPERLDRAPAPALAFGYALLGMAMFFAWPAENAPFVYFQF